MHDHLTGPFWGNVIIIALATAITLGCVVAMLWMLIRPGENSPTHPKRSVLKEYS